MITKRILCVSFSPIHADSRVLRQLEVLSEHGEVTTVGYGAAPENSSHHIQIPDGAASLPETPLGVVKLALRMHSSVELASPGEKAVLSDVLASGSYDLVVANDARAFPLAFAAAKGAPVYADMHEWAPEERATVLVWRLLVGPYMQHLCEKYLPKTAAVTSVSAGLAALYSEQFGIATEVVRNAADLRDLEPTPVDGDRIKLVHSGTADAERNIVELIDAVGILGDRFTLDLYLLGEPGGYIETVKKHADGVKQVTVHDPVPPATLPSVLNQYDLGVFLYPLKTLSHQFHLPNKFFDFVQARLGLVFSSAPEINDYVGRYDLGIITQDTTAQGLVEALRDITAADVTRFKKAAHAGAIALSSKPDKDIQHALVARLLSA